MRISDTHPLLDGQFGCSAPHSHLKPWSLKEDLELECLKRREAKTGGCFYRAAGLLPSGSAASVFPIHAASHRSHTASSHGSH